MTDSAKIEPQACSTASVFFLYHEILRDPSDYSYAVNRDHFRQHLEVFAKANGDQNSFFNAGITFDDGHHSDVEFALPMLLSAGMTAHFFITAGWTGSKPGYMDWGAVRELHESGQIIGAHGWSHKMLSRCSPGELIDELRRPKEALEDRLGAAVVEMSLPGGRLTSRVLRAAVEVGYEHIFTSVPEIAADCESRTVGRINITNTTRPADIEALLRKDGEALKRMARKHSMKLMLRRVMGDALYFKLWALRNGYVKDEETEI